MINTQIEKKKKKKTFLKLPYLLLLFVSSPFGSLGTVNRFGLRTVYEVQQLVHVPVVNGASCCQF